MAAAPKLSRFGDRIEQAYWGHLKKLVPDYETFWQLYVFPLRAHDSIWFEDGIDPQLEMVAITNYSTFAALGRARHKIYCDNERFRHVEELYTVVQRAVELGIKLVDEFARLEMKLCRSRTLSSASLVEFKDLRLSPYRNLLHDAMLAMPKEGKQRLIPKLDKIDEYRLWTTSMYHFRRNDFVVASVQVKEDFIASCSRLEDAWKEMCQAHKQLMPFLPFQPRDTSLEAPPRTLAGVPAASGDFYIGRHEANASLHKPFAVKNRA